MSELYQLPDGWEWSLFKDSLYLTDFVANGSFASLKENVSYLDYKDYAILVRLKDFSNKWNGDYVYVDKHSYDFLSKSSLYENDIMMCNVGSVGLHFRVPNLGQPMTIGPNSILIRPQKDELDNTFLYHYFSSNVFKDFLETIIATTAQPKFNKTGFKTLSIPLPPIEEQKRIVSKLDKLFEKIDKSISLHQKNMDEADVFMGSVLNDVFGELEEKYEIKSVDEVSLNVQYGYTDSAKEKGNAVFIRITDINENGKFKDNFVYVNIEEKELKKFKLYKGDILVARSGATAGKVALFDLDFTSVFASYLIRIQPNVNMDSSFFFYFCHSPKYWEQLNVIKVGGAQPNVNATNLKELRIPSPPLNIQQKVVKYLDEISEKIEKIKSVQKVKMDNLKALKASILDSAFRGEL